MNCIKKILGGVLAATLMVSTLSPMDVQAASVSERRNQGVEAAQAGEYDEAIDIFEQIIREGADTSYDDWYLGNLYFMKVWNWKAIEYYDIAWNRMDSEPDANRPKAGNWAFSAYMADLDWYVEQIYKQAKMHNAMDLQVEHNYGLALMDNGNYEAAVESLVRALDYCQGEYSDSNRGTIMIQIAKCYNYLGREEEALQLAEDGFALCNKQALYRSFAKEYYLEGNLMEMEEFVSTYLTDKTNKEIGDYLKDVGYYEEAISYYEKAQEEGMDTRLEIAVAYESWGYPFKAVEILEELLAEEPESTYYQHYLACYYTDGLGRYEEAADIFEKIAAMNPDENLALSNQAVVAQKIGDFEKAAEIRRQVLNKKPNDLSSIKNYLKAQTSLTLEQVSEIYSGHKDWTNYEKLQAVYLAQNLSISRLDNASLEGFLEYFVQADPNRENYILCSAQAYLLAELGRYEEAIAMWEVCRGLTDMMTYEIERGIGDCYKEMGRYDEAVAQYEKGYELENDSERAFNLADIYLRADNPNAAKAVLDQYVQNGGKQSDVLEMYMIWAGYAEDYEATLAYAEEYLVEYPSSVKAKAYKAVALKALGREEEANAVIADIDSINYSCSDTSKMIADSLLGRLDDAKAIYKVLLEQYPRSARAERNDYELKNLFYDAEFCQMAGREPWIKTESVPEVETGKTEPTVVEKEDTFGDSVVDTIQEKGPVAVPVVMTAVAALGALITVIVVAAKKKKNK